MMKEDKLGHRLIGNITFLLLLLAVLICFACSGKVIPKPSDTTYWRIGLDGEIFTNDLQRLQSEVPFIILLPDYLPEEFKNHTPDFIYTTNNPFVSGAISITTYYATTESPHSISIHEYILPGVENVITAPVFLDIKGYKVAERSWMEPISIGEKLMQNVHKYQWDSDNVYYSVNIRGYSQDEARRIVESIIK